MFDIKVSGIEESEYIRKTWATKAIGLVDPSVRLNSTQDYFIQKFHDVTEDIFNYKKPTKDQVIACLYFSRIFTPEDKILVHCHAGISRSTGIAISILIYHGLEIDEAFALIEKVRPFMWPNTLILHYADELLSLDGKLIRYDQEWKERHTSTLIGIGPDANKANVEEMERILERFNQRMNKTVE